MDELRSILYDELPTLARTLVLSSRYRDTGDPYRAAFAGAPDDPRIHSPSWHQWGVITHTREVGRRFEKELPEKLEDWFGPKLAGTRLGLLDEDIEGTSKWELLLTSVPTHDWGKFTVRYCKRGQPPRFRFGGHESESGWLVRERAEWFQDRGLSGGRLEYVARCAELHFLLGNLRDRARNQGGYHLGWVESPDFDRAVSRVLRQCPEYEREVGLFFLADNWGKTDLLEPGAATVEGPVIEAAIHQRGLHPDLVECVLQLPVNTAVGRRYLGRLLSR